jgi:WD40 repeat protein
MLIRTIGIATMLAVVAALAISAAALADEALPAGALARLGTNAFRHQHTVSALQFSADGKLLVSASWDKTARVWEVASGREVCRFGGHKEGASAVAISADCRLAASGDMKRNTVLWDALTGKEIHRTSDNENTVFWLRFSADGKRLIWSAGKKVRVWDVANWREERQIGMGDGVRPVVLAPDGRTLAAGCENGAIKIHNIDDGSLVKTLEGHSKMVFGLAYSADGRRLLSGAGDGEARLWDVESGATLHAVKAPDHWVRPVVFLQGGKQFTAAGQDGTVWIWNCESGQQEGQLQVSARSDLWVMAMAVSPDGQTLATAGREMAIRLWETKTR